MTLIQEIQLLLRFRKQLASSDKELKAIANLNIARICFAISKKILLFGGALRKKAIKHYVSAVTGTSLEKPFADEVGFFLFSIGEKELAYTYLKKAYDFQLSFIIYTILKEPNKLNKTNETLKQFITTLPRCTIFLSTILQEEGKFEESQKYCQEILNMFFLYKVLFDIIEKPNYSNIVHILRNFVANMVFQNSFNEIVNFFNTPFYNEYYQLFKEEDGFNGIIDIKEAILKDHPDGNFDIIEFRALQRWNQEFHSKIQHVSSTNDANKLWKNINQIVGNDEIKQVIHKAFNEMLSVIQIQLDEQKGIREEIKSHGTFIPNILDGISTKSKEYEILKKINNNIISCNESIDIISDLGINMIKYNMDYFSNQFKNLEKISLFIKVRWNYLLLMRNLLRYFILAVFFGSLIPMIFSWKVNDGLIASMIVSIVLMVLTQTIVDPRIDMFYTIRFKKILNKLLSRKYTEILVSFTQYVTVKETYLSKLNNLDSKNKSMDES